ncbi:uncharacterized protein LY79DRAFT_397298 [Colletotrichum navitas]|uniref:Uncharacterized protein n=1 Tax=Colletotrichum navitas TaxID=681940 RepID=A0AAD8PQF5_9PEZI|nr:uncharacterized protein LY79DRAFT_397298 [Colletotrichum navitas]KAK1573803.1 hypothetical protein LY79DRAFT_397298 [Colletotrichum navitas]
MFPRHSGTPVPRCMRAHEKWKREEGGGGSTLISTHVPHSTLTLTACAALSSPPYGRQSERETQDKQTARPASPETPTLSQAPALKRCQRLPKVYKTPEPSRIATIAPANPHTLSRRRCAL